ncbi:thermostable hemolysin [Ruegeria marisrubri]|uniref:thermostable hemolysin n=1 Tax=Ruegeria marisrubri TaxID=1685379 RepID=UPI001CD533EE|nr:thermostable hemolysin [Ruegeria marisrubri]MCA0905489.1 thermostable hemolysin [Ruegeria marisrubri]
MKIEFLEEGDPGRAAVEDHIRQVYRQTYQARIEGFAPLLVSARRRGGGILCAAGVRTAQDGFFSEAYLDIDFGAALLLATGVEVPRENIMEVVSLASTSPFPVLPMLDAMIQRGRDRGMTCGVFTATKALRRLLRRARLDFVTLAPADPARVESPEQWGSYYQADPWVCAFSEIVAPPAILSPKARIGAVRSEAS